MPPKKKPPQNAFYFFMLEFKNRQGRHYNSMKDVAEAAGPHWARMNQEQRLPYEQQAKASKNDKKFTSDGIEISKIERERQEMEQRECLMKEYIESEIKLANSSGRIDQELFFLIHITTHCYSQTFDKYFPAEIGISAFNLRDGVLPDNVYHKIILPGPLPLGFAAEAKLRSTETHQIKPPDTNESAEDNTQVVFEEIIEFLSDRMPGSKRLPVLYAEEKHVHIVQHILTDWATEYSGNRHLDFKVYKLQFMFKLLKNTVAGSLVWSSDTFAAHEIEKDIYAHNTNIACKFHELTPTPVHCCRSVVVRYAFIICDFCCADLDIDLVPGYHVPLKSFVVGSRPSSAASWKSSKSSHSSRHKKDSRSITSDDFSDTVSVADSDWETGSEFSSSTISNLQSEDSFPTLGGSRSRSNGTPYSALSNSSGKSYAGATGYSRAGFSKKPAALPSVLTGVQNLSLEQRESPSPKLTNTYDFPLMGRGRPSSRSNDVENFPQLGRGVRGSRGGRRGGF